MASFHNWTGDELIDTQVPQFLNEDNAATQEKLDTKFNNSLKITGAADLNNFKDEGFYYCNSNSQAETILNCPTNYAFGLMVWGKEDIFYQEVREFNRGSNQDYNNCWRRSYYFDGGQGVWSNWQRMSYAATTLAGYGITDGMSNAAQNSVRVPDFLKSNNNTSYLRLAGGDTFNKSATLQLYGGIHTTNAGQFLLNAADSTHSAVLSGSPSGILKWNNKNIVRSINNVAADENGNVAINVSGGGGSGSNITVDAELSSTSTNPVQNKVIKEALDNKLSKNDTAAAAIKDGAGNIISTTYAKKTDISGMVKSVNGTKPDASGNVNVEEYTHPNSGVTAGTYRSVTVNAQGHVTGGSNPTLAIAYGGTGATTAADAIKAFFGSRAIGSAGHPVYYDGSKLKAGGYTFRLNHNTTDDKILVFANGMLDYILKRELANATTGGGIVAALLEQNGYVKFSNGLILQWGYYKATSSSYTLTFPIAFSRQTCAVCVTSVNSGAGYPVTDTPNTNSIKISNKCYENFWIAAGF